MLITGLTTLAAGVLGYINSQGDTGAAWRGEYTANHSYQTNEGLAKVYKVNFLKNGQNLSDTQDYISVDRLKNLLQEKNSIKQKLEKANWPHAFAHYTIQIKALKKMLKGKMSGAIEYVERAPFKTGRFALWLGAGAGLGLAIDWARGQFSK